jgi:hypothetical protein
MMMIIIIIIIIITTIAIGETGYRSWHSDSLRAGPKLQYRVHMTLHPNACVILSYELLLAPCPTPQLESAHFTLYSYTV